MTKFEVLFFAAAIFFSIATLFLGRRFVRYLVQALRNELAEHDRARSESVDATSRRLSARIDTLEFERKRLVPILGQQPLRNQLVEAVMPALKPVHALLAIADTPDYTPLGDRDHMYKMKEKAFPYSVTDEEGLVLYFITTQNSLSSGYEIATAFGYSSFFLALALGKNNGKLTSMDAYLEEAKEQFTYTTEEVNAHVATLRKQAESGDETKLPVGFRFAREGAASLGVSKTVQYVIGSSPDDVATLLRDQKLDVAFIDGGHLGDQPIKDLRSIIPFLNQEKFALFFHDAIVPDVAAAVHLARKLLPDTSAVTFNTRNLMTIVHRGLDPRTIAACPEILARRPGLFQLW